MAAVTPTQHPYSKMQVSPKNERGAALVEFALVFTLLVFILYGLISFGMILALKQGVTNAASEGARAAVGATNPVGAAQLQAVDALSWIGPDKVTAVDAVATQQACVGAPASQCITMKVTYRYSDKPLVPPAPGLRLFTPDTFSSSATVQIGA